MDSCEDFCFPECGEEVYLYNLDIIFSPAVFCFGNSSEKVPIDQPITQTVTLKNNKDHDVYVLLTPKSDFNSLKCTLSLNHEMPFIVKSKSEEQLNITLQVHCTTETKLDLSVKTCNFGSTKYKESTYPIRIISEESKKLDIDDIEKENEIGRGQFGIVYKGYYRKKQSVAIKEIITQECMSSEEKQAIQRELKMLEDIRHENIVGFVGSVIIPGSILILTNYCRFGTIVNAMRRAPEKFTDTMKLICLENISRAMEFLHDREILLPYLKTDNILISSLDVGSRSVVKLSDFGITRNISNITKTKPMGGSSEPSVFMAPEILKGCKYIEKTVDVYNFSLIMYFIFSGIMPYEGDSRIKSESDIPNFVISGGRPIIPDSFPPEMRNLMERCWNEDPQQRPAIHDIHTHFSRLLGDRMKIKQGPIKLCAVGDSASGAKSCLIHRFTIGNFAVEDFPLPSTIGVAFIASTIEVDGVFFKLEIWDTAGQERFFSLTPMYLKGSGIVIVGYDVTNRKSFERCPSFIQATKNTTKGNCVIIGVGNKIDLCDKREVSKEEAIKLFEDNGVPADHYFETSALTGEGVNELFFNAVKLWEKEKDGFLGNENPTEHKLVLVEDEEGRKMKKGYKKRKDDCIIC